jgi:molybdopterin-guanine dinucleotide biosynthesis protein B
MRVIGIAGWSGAGKTTLLVKLIPALVARGLSVSTLKHAHHAFDVDKPGKDSFEHRQAGAREVLIASRKRWALMHELREEKEPTLAELLHHLTPVDLVLVEGFKHDKHLKIEVHRAENGKEFLFPNDANIKAVACDVTLPAGAPPRLDLNDVAVIADAVVAHAEPVETVLQRLRG